MILLGLLGVGVFFWAAKSGQFDDLEGEASRILMDDDLRASKLDQGSTDQNKEENNPDRKE